jgi:signal transduction histidine kinase
MRMKWWIGKGASFGFALAAAVLVTSGVISYLQLRRIEHNQQMVLHTHEVLDAVHGTLTDLVDVETAQRGYIITGLDEYLDVYRKAAPRAKERIAEVQRLTKDNPLQQKTVADLVAKTEARLQRIEGGIAARREQGPEAGRDFVASGVGKGQMDEIRRVVADMEDEETRLLKIRTYDMAASHRSAKFSNLVSLLMGLALVGTGYFLAAQEITTRKRATEELEGKVQARTQELHEMNGALKTSNRELEQFASVASHDLQEPLRKIEAFGDRLRTRSATLDEQSRDYLERVLVSASRMRTLINDLLSFSRITTRAQPFSPVDLSRVAEEVLSDLEARVQQVGGKVELGTLPKLEADPMQMRQLLQNLIGNALKFSKPGVAPVVTVSASDVTDDRRGRRCQITVKDNGIGFEEVYLDRIFEVFQRLHGRNEYEGTGIGLAICRKIAERHGGSITARSAPDQGATFIVTLPYEQTETTTDSEKKHA